VSRCGSLGAVRFAVPRSLPVHVLRLECLALLSRARALVLECVVVCVRVCGCLSDCSQSVCLVVQWGPVVLTATECVGDWQRKMAELASKKGAAADDAAAKKAAFLKEAEEAVRRAAQSDADRKSAVKNAEVSSTYPPSLLCDERVSAWA